jgi:hypothetical protein
MTAPDGDAERRDDLAATSESLQADARRLLQIEEEKQGLEMGDPRLHDLSREAERLAGDVEHKSQIERGLSEGEDREPPRPGGSSN